MKKLSFTLYLPLLLGCLNYGIVATAQLPGIDWDVNYGGSSGEIVRSVRQTSDGGYIVGAYTWSNDGHVTGYHDDGDYWILKLSATGALEWEKCLGGSKYEYAHAVIETSEGKYVVTGISLSDDGDVSGHHPDMTTSAFCYDIWVVMLDATGEMEWEKSLGGSGIDWSNDVIQTTDGNFVVVGSTMSTDGDVNGTPDGVDWWILKLSGTGEVLWQKLMGGMFQEEAHSVSQTTDGGYIVAGYTLSNNGDVSGNHGLNDYWVVKLDASGDIQWQHCFGGAMNDEAIAVRQTFDGGYIVGGNTRSGDGDVSGYHGGGDLWVIKLTETGELDWQRSLGGSGFENLGSVEQTIDGGYVVIGSSSSTDHDVAQNQGSSDMWIVKLTNTGAIDWQRSLGGVGAEVAYDIAPTSDGGYVAGGANTDAWIIKLGGDASMIPEVITDLFQVFPNPTDRSIFIHSELEEKGTIRIYTLTGEKIYQAPMKSMHSTIDISGYQNGCYIVEVIYGTKTSRQRIIIE